MRYSNFVALSMATVLFNFDDALSVLAFVGPIVTIIAPHRSSHCCHHHPKKTYQDKHEFASLMINTATTALKNSGSHDDDDHDDGDTGVAGPRGTPQRTTTTATSGRPQRRLSSGSTSPRPNRGSKATSAARRRRQQQDQRQRTLDETDSTKTTTTTTKYQVASKRAPHQFDHTKADARPFIDAAQEIQSQNPNENAPAFDYEEQEHLACTTTIISGTIIEDNNNHVVQIISLDELFPIPQGANSDVSFSELFSSNQEFRNDIRNAIRRDIFDTTSAYANMSDKARRMLLLPDSSLQGSWRCSQNEKQQQQDKDDEEEENSDNKKLRMKQLTRVFEKYFGESILTGDEFMNTIGNLCGSQPQTHWMDIVGVTDRKISHSWHQDTGRSPNNDTKTVLLGFPKENNYVGSGVFSHLVKLKCEHLASDEHPPNEPILYTGSIDDKYIYRPQFAKGQEIIIYRDVDVLHSAPDVAYRSSVMRFM